MSNVNHFLLTKRAFKFFLLIAAFIPFFLDAKPIIDSNKPTVTGKITTSILTGSISACVGTASANPNIEEFTVSATGLSADIVATVSSGFEISFNIASGYGNSLTITQTGGSILNKLIYVRSSALAPVGIISGNVALISPGTSNQYLTVTGRIKALPTVNKVANQVFTNAINTTAISFTGTANTYNWVNDNPGIGLAANGSGKINSFSPVNNGSSPITATITVTPVSSARAYLVYGNLNTLVDVYDVATGVFVASIPVGVLPYGLSLSPDGRILCVANSADYTVSIINTLENTVIAKIPVSSGAIGVAFSPDGSKIYVGSTASVAVISTATNTVITTIGGVRFDNTGIVVSPDGSAVYVANGGLNTVTVLNALTNTVSAVIPVGNSPEGLVITPDGSRVYVANSANSTVKVINTITNSVISTIAVGNGPFGLTISPDGSTIYVANSGSNTISVINTASNIVTNTFATGTYPTASALNSDGSLLYVENTGSNSISTFSTTDFTKLSTFGVGSNPSSFGNFIAGGTGCTGPSTTFTLTVNPTNNGLPAITSSGAPSVLTTIQGTASTSTSFSVSATNTQTGILVTPPPGFEVSKDNNTFSNTVTIGATGNIAATIVYLRLAATTSAGTYSGNIALSSTGAMSVNVLIASCTVSPVVVPVTITASNAVGNISACEGAASASPNISQFTVSGSGLRTSVSVTAPVGFEVSLTVAGNYSNVVSIPQANGTINALQVYVRSAFSAPAGIISGNITLSSAGSADQTVAVTGLVKTVAIVNTVTNQTVITGATTSAINFTGTAAAYTWVNNTPGIGLAASGTGNILAFTPINKTDKPITATITVTPVPSKGNSLAYITDSNPGTGVWVFNTQTNETITNIRVGIGPQGIALSPDGTRLYVTNEFSSSVSVINTAENKVLFTVSVGVNPRGICVSPDGSRVYVANYSSNNISVINTLTNLVVATISVGRGPQGLCLSPDGSNLYVACSSTASNNITIINTSTNSITSTIAVGNLPSGLCISPDGARLYATGNNILTVLNTTNNTVLARITVGSDPYGVAISHDGTRVYVANSGSTTVSVINTSTNTVIETIGVGSQPVGVSLTADDSQLYVTNSSSYNYSVINTATDTVTYTSPDGVIIASPASFGSFISGGSSGCSGPPIIFTITVNPTLVSVPVINVTGSLTALSTSYGTLSTSTTFSLSGVNISGGIVVTPPVGFEVSTDNATFSNMLTVGGQGSIAQTLIYIRLASGSAGSYAGNIVLTSVGASSINLATSTSTITRAPLTITANNQTKFYGAALPVLTASYSGFVKGDTFASLTTQPILSTTATAGSSVNTYPVTASGAVSNNYAITYMPGTLTVNTATLTITANNQTKVYGAALPVLTASYSGFVNGDTFASLTTQPILSTTATAASPVGQYIIAALGAVSPNYSFLYINGSLTITPITRTLTFNALPIKTYGDTDFSGGAIASSGETVIYSGYDPSVITITNGLIHITGAGVTTINATLANNSNFINTPSQNQTLTVNKANQTINLLPIPTQLRGATYSLSGVIASSGLAVAFSSSDLRIAAVNGTTLNSFQIGQIQLTAVQPGNNNYYAAASVTTQVIINDIGGNEIIVHQAVSPNGDGINDFLQIEGLQNYPSNRVTIINRNGVKIYEINGYDNANNVFDGHSNITGVLQQQGTYFYLIEYIDNGQERRKKGFFVLKY